MQPAVLIASTTSWPMPARIAMAFAELGARVDAVCWYGNPMTRTRCVRRRYHYAALRPIASLARAIELAAPDLILPCDERALGHLLALHEIYSTSGQPDLAALVARSIGDPHASAEARSRAAFIGMAQEAGVRAPRTVPVDGSADLQSALQQVGLPAFLKVDDSWGGEGVAKVSSMADAERQFQRMSRPLRPSGGLHRLVTIGDPFQLMPSLRRARQRVNVQAFVAGRPANCVAACWQGEVLALIQVDVLRATHATGPAMIVQLADHADIAEAARRVAGRLGLSGFCGLDFIIAEATGEPYLIEMNQRITPLGHLGLGDGRDPVVALASCLGGRRSRTGRAMAPGDIIALFPQAWLADPASPHLSNAYHDVPWAEPALILALARRPWQQRSVIMRLIRRRRFLRRQDHPGGVVNFVVASTH
jgi:biotin carboxylase